MRQCTSLDVLSGGRTHNISLHLTLEEHLGNRGLLFSDCFGLQGLAASGLQKKLVTRRDLDLLDRRDGWTREFFWDKRTRWMLPNRFRLGWVYWLIFGGSPMPATTGKGGLGECKSRMIA